jgi:hypothetical protein
MIWRTTFAAATFAAFLASTASAAPLVPTENNDGLPDLNDAVEKLFPTLTFASNTDIAPLKISDGIDQLFKVSSDKVPLVGLTAGNSNTLGYYDDPGTGSNRFSTGTAFSGFGFLGSGVSGDPFPGVELIPSPGNKTIGFYLESVSGSGTNTFFSEPGLNSDELDHLIAYDLSILGSISVVADFGSGETTVNFANPVLLGWEDLVGGGDNDFDDTIYLADVTPVPVPASIFFFGAGLLGLGCMIRRNQQRQA